MMRKSLMLLISLFLLLAAALPAAWGEELSFAEYGDLLGHLAVRRPEALDCVVSEDLYAFLQPNDFRELFRLLVRAGIDQDRAQISYNDGARYISLGSLQYADRPYAECLSPADVSRTLREHAPSASDLVFLCSDELLSALTVGGQLNILAAQAGIGNYSYRFSSASGILTLTSPEYFTVPYASVGDYAQFSLAVSEFADRGLDEFIIIFDPELFGKILESPEEMTIMLAGSKLLSYSGTYVRNSCVFHYTDVTYTDMPREICRYAGDAEEAVRRMGSAGIREFELVFPYRGEFEKLIADDFALLYELEGRAGMSRAELSWDSINGRLIFRSAEIVADASVLQSAEEAIAYTERMIAEFRTDIHLFCTPELYAFLLEDGAADASVPQPLIRIYDLITGAGIFDYDITISEAVRVISIHINALFPGTEILRAVRSGDPESLSERLRQTLETAAGVADAAEAESSDPLRRAQIIHDWICAHTEYTVDETTDEDDTAVGAILSGRANCDGYADAFFLIGNLAGLNVRLQHGESLDKGSKDMLSSVTHLWNLLEIGGVWHMVDVTWDDEETGWTYIWFNVGRDIAERMHYRNEEMAAGIAETTDRAVFSEREFYVRTDEELYEAVDLAHRRRLSDFYILFEGIFSDETAAEVRDLVGQRLADGMLTWSWNEKMGLLGFYGLHW